MNIYTYPERTEWTALLKRPTHDASSLNATVADILRQVREEGDDAVRRMEERFDHATLTHLRVSQEEMEQALSQVEPSLLQALQLAHRNIHRFHEAQRFQGEHVEVCPGVTCWQQSIPIQSVGLYIPGGTAPLFSTVLMLATPARIAGCRRIVLCTPPAADGHVHPAILAAAHVAGVDEVYKVGGVQAIAAMAYGTESIPKVHKIFGPGNQYVMCAKQQVSLHDVAIDMPAGPSEVEVIADATSHIPYVAADLLSQAEHGRDSQVLLVTDEPSILEPLQEEVQRQLEALPRRDIAAAALEHSKFILVHDRQEIMDMTNQYAPEHLIIETDDHDQLATQVLNAGSVFLGHLTPESAGDYASGTNHTLPTNGYATAYSGVNLDSFCRKVTFQKLTPEGIRHIGPAVELMATGEQLHAHCHAMTLRLEDANK